MKTGIQLYVRVLSKESKKRIEEKMYVRFKQKRKKRFHGLHLKPMFERKPFRFDSLLKIFLFLFFVYFCLSVREEDNERTFTFQTCPDPREYNKQKRNETKI